MPIGAAGASLIAAGVGVATTAGNAYATGRMNKKNRKFAEHMYDRQRGAALEDWARQNEYNSPRAQMQRFQEAGLNKNLIYGNISDGPAVRSTSSAEWRGEAPQADPNMGLELAGKYFDMRQKSAQTDMVAKQMSIADAELLLKKAQIDSTKASTEQTIAQTDGTKFDVNLKTQLQQNSLDAADANLKKTMADTKYTLNQDQRAAAQNAQSIKEGVERILRSMAERSKIPLEKQEIMERIKHVRADTRIKNLDADLKQKGIQPHDKLWQRTLMEAFQYYKPASPAEKDAKKFYFPQGGSGKR
jgi:hypothetical protein